MIFPFHRRPQDLTIRQLPNEEIVQKLEEAIRRAEPKAKPSATETLQSSLSYQISQFARRRAELEDLIRESQEELADVTIAGDITMAALKKLAEHDQPQPNYDLTELEKELESAATEDLANG